MGTKMSTVFIGTIDEFYQQYQAICADVNLTIMRPQIRMGKGTLWVIAGTGIISVFNIAKYGAHYDCA